MSRSSSSRQESSDSQDEDEQSNHTSMYSSEEDESGSEVFSSDRGSVHKKPSGGAHPVETESEEEPTPSEQSSATKNKRKAPPKDRDWAKVKEWNKGELSETEMQAVIRFELDELARIGGVLQVVPSRQDDKINQYGSWRLRRKWSSHHGVVTNIVLSCALAIEQAANASAK